MTLVDSLCYFCQADCEYSDIARSYSGRLWCGQCRQGREILFEHYTTEQLVEQRDTALERYARNPIDWNAITDTGSTPPDHLERLDLSDTVDILNSVLIDRGYTNLVKGCQ